MVADESRPDATLLGIGLLLIATVLFAIQDVLTKQLTTRVSVTQILVLRYFAFTVFALIMKSESLLMQ